MGEKQTKPFQLSFNGSLKVDFQAAAAVVPGDRTSLPTVA